jgi:squalene-hopene/tetraprenyl-beta-curcumene cyclase
MSFEPQGSSRIGQFQRGDIASAEDLASPAFSADGHGDPRLRASVDSAAKWLIERQHPDGYWVGELEGDSILESEYILLLAWLGRGQDDVARKAARYILSLQQPHGGWALYPGGPLEISASVKAYLALKITGQDPASPAMQHARQAIRDAGGAEQVNSFTRYYLALLGLIAYHKCPAVPPEIMLLPKWAPFNIYEMSAWSRTILVPLSLLWAHQPAVRLPEEHRIDELFLGSAETLPAVMPRCRHLDRMRKRTLIPWESVFRLGDRAWKLLENLRLKPFRRVAIRRAEAWIVERLADSDGLGAIFPPIIWSVIALKCLGYADDSAEVSGALRELERLVIDEHGLARLQPCKSPVWDTAISLIALREAGVESTSAPIAASRNWLLDREIRRRGDWSVRKPNVEPAGWCFEFNNAFYPDIDDTIMVVMALASALPGECHSAWTTSLVAQDGNSSLAEPFATTFAGRTSNTLQAVADIEDSRRALAAIGRGIRWVLAMQCRDGGWGAFDADNTREVLTRVPFADHNAMIDPPTADITGRVLEMFGRLGADVRHPQLQRGLDFVWREQEPDSSWVGRWGVNYLYGTWQCLVGLRAIGVETSDPRVRSAADWLKGRQQSCGGWGETARSYDEPALRGQGTPTASQTAWALMGLMAAGEVGSLHVERGIRWLIDTQTPPGTWDENEFTGTGFPRVFYLRYHLYRHYFPLMALGRYARLSSGDQRAKG